MADLSPPTVCTRIERIGMTSTPTAYKNRDRQQKHVDGKYDNEAARKLRGKHPAAAKGLDAVLSQAMLEKMKTIFWLRLHVY